MRPPMGKRLKPVAARSAAATAHPSMAELSNGGTMRPDTISLARIRPEACRKGRFSTAATAVNVWSMKSSSRSTGTSGAGPEQASPRFDARRRSSLGRPGPSFGLSRSSFAVSPSDREIRLPARGARINHRKILVAMHKMQQPKEATLAALTAFSHDAPTLARSVRGGRANARSGLSAGLGAVPHSRKSRSAARRARSRILSSSSGVSRESRTRLNSGIHISVQPAEQAGTPLSIPAFESGSIDGTSPERAS